MEIKIAKDVTKPQAPKVERQKSAPSQGRSPLLTKVRETAGYEAQVSLLKPRPQGEKKAAPKTPASTAWSAVVRKNFSIWDKDHDGFISRKEANEVLSDPSVTGDDAVSFPNKKFGDVTMPPPTDLPGILQRERTAYGSL